MKTSSEIVKRSLLCLGVLAFPFLAFGQAVPVGEDAKPIGERSGPVGQDAVPVGERSGPVGQDAVPIGEGAVPIGQDAYPIGAKSGPVGQDAVPVGQDAVPVGQDAVPVGQDAVPVGQDAVPVGEDAVPVGQDAVPTNSSRRESRLAAREASRKHPNTAHLFQGPDGERWVEAEKRLVAAIKASSPLSKEVLTRRQADNKQWAASARVAGSSRPTTVFSESWWEQYRSQLEKPALYAVTRPLSAWWESATWDSLRSHLEMKEDTEPFLYVYDRNVTFSNDVIYVNGEPIASHADFVSSAQRLARAELVSAKNDWLPLGTFLLSTKPGEASNPQALQLAVNSAGNISGVYAHWASKGVHIIEGKVDPIAQRVAFSIGGQQQITLETGLANLTQDEVRLWVHLDKEHSQTWLLSRVDPPPSE